ncbi:MAG: UbiH/UbiF/VisC/COQ6 family ubiquinone biosynthesis hydroxylase [Gammaproteobacteria bacterium]|nr:2-octaprenyl-3-methyl-6-methoxy-1,4-benzoquinol hydroxylase [Gammaproteobacteria bacterium]
MRTDFGIVVIGGGLVGACTAALAAAEPAFANLPVALIEANPLRAPPPPDVVDLRVSALSVASARILDSFGAWSALDARYKGPYCDMVVWDAAGKPYGTASIHFSASGSSEPNLGHIVENKRLLWCIYGTRAFRDGVSLLEGELASLDLDEERAELTLTDGRKYTAQLVVGSDGAQSLSRKLAGIEVSCQDYDQAAFVTHVKTALPHRQTAWQRFLPDGPIAFLPLADGRSSIVWTTKPEHAQALVRDSAARVEAELEAAIDGVLGKVTLDADRVSIPLRMIHARRYCTERFVLVGDAAHTVHPLAGQGVNLGFLDSAALIEVLAEELTAGGTVETFCERRVLRRYERWRKSENTLALAFIDGLNRLFGSGSGVAASARRWGLGVVDQATPLKRFLMGRAMGTTGELPRLALAHPGSRQR